MRRQCVDLGRERGIGEDVVRGGPGLLAESGADVLYSALDRPNTAGSTLAIPEGIHTACPGGCTGEPRHKEARDRAEGGEAAPNSDHRPGQEPAGPRGHRDGGDHHGEEEDVADATGHEGEIVEVRKSLLLYRHKPGTLVKHYRYLHDRTDGSIYALADLIRDTPEAAAS